MQTIFNVFIEFVTIVVQSLNHVRLFCDPLDCSQPGSNVHGILQANILEWIAISSSRRPSQPRDQIQVCHISCTGRFSTTETLRKSQDSFEFGEYKEKGHLITYNEVIQEWKREERFQRQKTQDYEKYSILEMKSNKDY